MGVEQHPQPAFGDLASVDEWLDRNWDDGVQLETVPPRERITVRTQNHAYELVVLSGETADVLIRGGEFFPRFSRVRLSGATAGGRILKRRGVYVGLCMELVRDRRRIVTSPVREVSRLGVEADDAAEE